MYGICHRVTYSQNSTERVGPRTEMRYLSKKFKGMTLLLEWICLRIRLSVEFNLLCLNLNGLTAAE